MVIDEFATLAAELPDFIDALIGVAQRGRSLGVHLILATQRPSGVVSDNIAANTNLRIALRVQDATESTDVIGTPSAASLPRQRPGRAIARLGPGELVSFQTALVSDLAVAGGRAAVEVVTASPARSADTSRGPTDLDQLVVASREAFARSGRPVPPSPWPEPLPTHVDAQQLTPPTPTRPFASALIPFVLADHPDQQNRAVGGWTPGRGNLLLIGGSGSGTTTALRTLAHAVIRGWSPDDVHLYAIDFGVDGLAALAEAPHTGAVIGAHESERQQRLLRWLSAEIARRKTLADESEPRLVLLLDGLAGWRERGRTRGGCP